MHTTQKNMNSRGENKAVIDSVVTRASHPVLVLWDYDHGWIVETWEDGEYEIDFACGELDGVYDEETFQEDIRIRQLDRARGIARERGVRVLHWFEWPHRIAEKQHLYRVAMTGIDTYAEENAAALRGVIRKR